MVDIGFKNSSTSDHNEGPTPPPDWNTIVVDGPPPDWNTIGDVGLKTCYEVTLIYMSVRVHKKDAAKDPSAWMVRSDMNHVATERRFPTLAEIIASIVKSATAPLWKDRLEYLIPWLPSLRTTTIIDGPGSIIKLCVCLNAHQFWAGSTMFLSWKCKWKKSRETHRSRKPPWDTYTYRCAKFKISCEGCVSKTCRCVNAKSINLTNITNKSTKYTDSNGNNVTLTNPGDYKKVIEQIVAAEDKIGLDCK